MIKDSGNRREFDSGAVRDIDDAKGRCDLLPLDIVGLVTNDVLYSYLNNFIRTGKTLELYKAIKWFCKKNEWDIFTAILEVSIHYKDGCEKYGERNWEKGIPLHCYMDSAIRHYTKCLRGDNDERHDRAFLWNLFGAWWTVCNKPELNDLPFKENENENH